MEGVWGGSQVRSRPAAPQKHCYSPAAAPPSQGAGGGASIPKCPEFPFPLQPHTPCFKGLTLHHTFQAFLLFLCFTMLLLSLLTTSLNIGTMGASLGTSMVAQMVKNLPAMQETRVQSLGQEDPLEKGMETHSSILPWRIPWIEEPGGLQFLRAGHNWTINKRQMGTKIQPVPMNLQRQFHKSTTSLSQERGLWRMNRESFMFAEPGFWVPCQRWNFLVILGFSKTSYAFVS